VRIGLKVYVTQVGIDGVYGNVKLVGNIFSAPGLGDLLYDLFFPSGKHNFFFLKHFNSKNKFILNAAFKIRKGIKGFLTEEKR
jgi:hypothetical protein